MRQEKDRIKDRKYVSWTRFYELQNLLFLGLSLKLCPVLCSNLQATALLEYHILRMDEFAK